MDKANLFAALTLTYPALGGDLIKGLSSYHFRGNTVTAFNGVLLLTATMDFQFPVTGSIEGQTLFNLVKNLGDDITLEAQGADRLMIKSGRSKTIFPIEDIDLTMLEDIEESAGDVHLPTHPLFAQGLERCLNSIGGKGIPQEEIGVHVFVEDEACHMYSTNLATFSRFQFPVEGNTTTHQVFLPGAFCEQLLYVYSKLDNPPSAIRVSQKYVRAQFQNVTLRSSFYSNPVNLKLKKHMDTCIDDLGLVTIPEALLDAVKRSEAVAGGKLYLRLDGDEGLLYVRAAGTKKQEFYDEVELGENYPFSSMDLSLDVKALKRMLPTCKEMGFGENYLILIGNEGHYDYLMMTHTEQNAAGTL